MTRVTPYFLQLITFVWHSLSCKAVTSNVKATDDFKERYFLIQSMSLFTGQCFPALSLLSSPVKAYMKTQVRLESCFFFFRTKWSSRHVERRYVIRSLGKHDSSSEQTSRLCVATLQNNSANTTLSHVHLQTRSKRILDPGLFLKSFTFCCDGAKDMLNMETILYQSDKTWHWFARWDNIKAMQLYVGHWQAVLGKEEKKKYYLIVKY